ncbi:transposase [Nostoc punctiforme FACHB-252]|jgi:transposase|uniref:Transposase n=1 Tax=Nostoc punctiforme FACHB-252 TaxID=1357509 RepID=A0ABR8HAV6_NOSPU|nr:transposase [Nostoc punctiforme FACHB-252]
MSSQQKSSTILAILATIRLVHFFLPPYSPQINRIEDEWLHLKRYELSSHIFDDEYELAIALIETIENRANNGNYSVERGCLLVRKGLSCNCYLL